MKFDKYDIDLLEQLFDTATEQWLIYNDDNEEDLFDRVDSLKSKLTEIIQNSKES
jgi:hypothetical protein